MILWLQINNNFDSWLSVQLTKVIQFIQKCNTVREFLINFSNAIKWHPLISKIQKGPVEYFLRWIFFRSWIKKLTINTRIQEHCNLILDDCIELLEFIFNNNYFVSNSKFYKEIFGLGMGNCLYNICADIVV